MSSVDKHVHLFYTSSMKLRQSAKQQSRVDAEIAGIPHAYAQECKRQMWTRHAEAQGATG